MKINNRISDSISQYTCYTDKSQIIKILIDPINYLEGLKKSNHFKITESFIYYENNFIKYMEYIVDMFKQGYYNYYNYPNNLDFVLYRAMSENEFNKLNNVETIDTFYSTFSSFANARNYILDNYEDVYKENHYIVEFNLHDILPYIDVSVDSSNSYEKGETILLPEFKINNMELLHQQHYYYTIYEAKADIEPIVFNNYNIDEIYLNMEKLYIDIIEGLYNNGTLINSFLNNDNINIKDNKSFIEWAKKLSEYLKLINISQHYIMSKEDSKTLKKYI